MSNTPSTTCFSEQSDFSLLLARGTAAGRSVRIESCQEISLADLNALATAASVLTAGQPLICALRPKIRRLHLASATEAAAHAGLAGARAFARDQPALAGQDPAWAAAATARAGAAPNTPPWLLAVTSNEGRTQAFCQLDRLQLKPGRCVSATHQLIGALAGGAPPPTLVLEFGELSSHLLLIGPDGLLAASPTTLNLDRVAEAVQTELGMKFRGSAVKLFFGADYDFTEAGPKIVARLAVALKAEVAALRGKAPAAFLCTGLPAAQNWFGLQLGAALGLSPFAPKMKAWSAERGLTFATTELEASVSASWLGFLHLIGTAPRDPAGGWQAEWTELNESTSSAPAPAATAKASMASVPPAPIPPAAKSPAKPAPPPPAQTPAAPELAARSTNSGSSVPYPPKSVPTQKAATKRNSAPAPAKSVVAVAMSKVASAAERKLDSPTPVTTSVSVSTPPPSFLKRAATLAVAAVALLLVTGGFFYAQAQREEAVRVAADKARAEERLQAETQRARLAEQSARAELEARRKFEAEATQKLAASDAARQLAEDEARTQVAARLANARGTLVVREPVGALVTVGELLPRTVPATFEDIKIGRYPVTVTLANHDPAIMELEVRENATTEAGPLKLERLVGNLVITCEPAGTAYSVRPANGFFVAPGATRSGRTPATLLDLAPGQYVVSFTREGWPVHDETVTIGRDATTNASWAFRTGLVQLDSTPAGATVTREGAVIGVTPLTLSDQTPGEVVFEFSLSGYESETLSGRIESGQLLSLRRTLEDESRISRLGDTDERPVALVTPQPEIGARRIDQPVHVDIQLVVDRYGNTRELAIGKSDNPEIAKLCLAAAAKWKFKPATIKGRPVNVRVSVPFNIMPAS